jgi:hypothetical protein
LATGKATAPGGDFEMTVCSESKLGGKVAMEVTTADPSPASLGWIPSAQIVTLLASSGESGVAVDSPGEDSPFGVWEDRM